MPDASLQRKLRNWQMLLLDLTRANRLLYFKAERGSLVPITSPTSAELFHQLVTQGKQLKFPAADERAAPVAGLEDAVALFREGLGQRPADQRLIVDDEDAGIRGLFQHWGKFPRRGSSLRCR